MFSVIFLANLHPHLKYAAYLLLHVAVALGAVLGSHSARIVLANVRLHPRPRMYDTTQMSPETGFTIYWTVDTDAQEITFQVTIAFAH